MVFTTRGAELFSDAFDGFGVGLKAALAILSHLSPENLPFAWRQGMSNPLPAQG